MKEVPPPAIATPTPEAPRTSRIRTWRHHLYRYLVDRRNRRHAWFVLASLSVIGILAATKGAIGYHLGTSRTLTLEVALAVAAVVAVGFGLGQKRLERAIEARFMRNTHAHRKALTALADELAAMEDHDQLAQAVVDRFDALFGTRGTALYRQDHGADYARIAANDSRYPDRVAATDVVVQQMLATHAPVAAGDLASQVNAPMVWPLRIRGQLSGFLAAGEHRYIESFDPDEVTGVIELANATATTLALLEPVRPEHAPPMRPPLPLHLSSFMGRDDAMNELRALLQSHRLTTVTGPVGIGKSRLLVEVAEAAAADYPGGVVWADLAACTVEDALPVAIARAMGIPAHLAPTSYADLAGHWGRDPALLILDGCESIREAGANAAATLLAAAPSLSIAATSQQALGVSGEREYPLPPLASDVANAAAVTLFIERTRAVLPGFVPNAATRGVIVDICAALGGMPLPIELAAARMKYVDAVTIRDGLYTPAGGDHAPGATSHAHSLQAALAASFAHLSTAERAAAHALAALDDPFSLKAAATGAFGDDTERAARMIAQLVDKSWLCRLNRRDGVASAHYRMLAPLRRYALDRAPSSDHDASGILLPARDPPPGSDSTP